MILLHGLDDLPGSVGRIVVDDDDFGAGRGIFQDLEDDRADIVALVVGREDDGNVPCRLICIVHGQ